MDIIDVLLARALTPGGQSETIVNNVKRAAADAKTAVKDAQSAVDNIDSITEQTNINNETAVSTIADLQAATEELNSQLADMDATINEKIATAINNDELIAAVQKASKDAKDAKKEADSALDKAAALQETATNAVNSATTATTKADKAAADAEQAKKDAAAALAAAQSGTGVDIEEIDASTSAAKIKKHRVKKGKTTKDMIVEKNYTSSGSNEDGSMTQKAITNLVGDTKQELTTIINNIQVNGNGNGSINLGDDNAGQVVVIGPDGNISSSSVAEIALIEALIKSGAYEAKSALGIEVDYANKTFERTQQAVGLEKGRQFDKYSMYGGRRRCNVSDDGRILAFYGESGYKEDGSNGQVMVYCPKFYYQRVPMKSYTNDVGRRVDKESIMVSNVAQTGFKLHPIFRGANDEVLDYVLISAYEGGLYDVSANQYWTTDKEGIDFDNDKMSSVAGVKPISGANNDFNMLNAEKLAANRGEGWHITNLAAESMNQLLEVVEFGTFNGQAALGSGVTDVTSVGAYNCATLTGSTASLGSLSGAAPASVTEVNGTTATYNEGGKVNISYRGMEAPWGDLWRIIGGLNIFGNGQTKGGLPYICKDFNYSYDKEAENYEPSGVILPSIYGWVASMCYSNNPAYDWVFVPAMCDGGANSALPVGDRLWSLASFNGIAIGAIGGLWASKESAGPFYYGFDKRINEQAQKSFGARMMFIPTKNAIYEANYKKWLKEIGA